MCCKLLPSFFDIAWWIWDKIFLFQIGSVYLKRFKEGTQENGDNFEKWRKRQQDEWDRLSTTLGLLATMQAAILAIQPETPRFSFATWIGGAGLSVCGLFIVQYFPIKALNIESSKMQKLLNDDSPFNKNVLAAAVSSPLIIAFWSSALFVIGIVNYLIETNMGGVKYRVIGILPVAIGIISSLAIVVIGEILERRVQAMDDGQELKQASTVLEYLEVVRA